MLIEDEGIIISKLKYGENSFIVKIFTRANGVTAGLVKGVKKYNSVAQVGNYVSTEWKGRLSEHLGNFSLELKKPFASNYFDSYQKMLALNSASALLAKVLPEKAPYKILYNETLKFLNALEEENWLQHYIIFELRILEEMGYGLDLSSCVATGVTDSLAYISPKSGGAVSVLAGEPYKDKLFLIPSFFKAQMVADTLNIVQNSSDNIMQEILEGLRITRYFMAKHLFAEFNYSMPNACHEFMDNLTRKFA